MARRNGGFVGQDGLDAPDPPTGITPTAGNAEVSVAFTAPSDVGTSALTGFVVQVSTDDTAYSAGSNTGTSSPIVVSSLTNGTAATAKVWAINAYGTSAPSAASASFSPVGTKGVIGGGYNSSNAAQNVLEIIVVATTGNASDFGDLTVARGYLFNGQLASATRGIFAGGQNASNAFENTIDYITIASAGNATDFGNLAAATLGGSSVSNATRGVFITGYASNYVNTIQYITIANTGNTTDFGDVAETAYGNSGFSSTTRGVSGSNAVGAGEAASNKIEYITIASTGNGSDFGDLTLARKNGAGLGNNTRGLFGGGFASAHSNVIDYVTIASTGNATDFGDMAAEVYNNAGVSSPTRGVFSGGQNQSAGSVNSMEYVTIANTGNTTDFGDLTARQYILGGTSNGHGGIAA